MSINRVFTSHEGEPTVTINVSEYFDYQCVHDFRNAFTLNCANDETRDADYVVDLSLTKYIDSCALGMLLSLDKFVRKRARQLRIVNCNEHVRKIFTLVHFDKKLSIQ